MNYAIIENGAIAATGTTRQLWPGVSFARSGPHPTFLAEKGAIEIRQDAPFDPATEALVFAEPYLLNGAVYDRVAAPKPPPAADWAGFLGALRSTTVFAALRGQARLDVAANALATELRTVLGEAALGLVEAQAVQGLVDELLPTLTPEQIAEIDAGILAFNIPLSTAGG